MQSNIISTLGLADYGFCKKVIYLFLSILKAIAKIIITPFFWFLMKPFWHISGLEIIKLVNILWLCINIKLILIYVKKIWKRKYQSRNHLLLPTHCVYTRCTYINTCTCFTDPCYIILLARKNNAIFLLQCSTKES